jgi:replicative DNA helicase
MYSEARETNLIQFPVATPPQSVDSEIAVLSAVLCSPSALDAILGLNANDFYVPAHREIFRIMGRLRQKQLPPDRFQIMNFVHGTKTEKAIADAIKTLEQGEGVLHLGSMKSLVELIQETARRRRLIEIAGELSRLAAVGDSQEAIASTQQALIELRTGGDRTIRLNEAIADAMALLAQENAGDEAMAQGVQTGFYDLDEITGCLPFGALSVLGGRGGMGKSTFALDIALRSAQNGINTVFFALEMNSSQMAKKSLVRLASPHVPSEKLFRLNQLQGKDWDALNNANAANSDLPFWVNDDPRMTVSDIRAELQNIVAMHGHAGFVVVDYVQLVRPIKASRAGTRTDEIYEILQELRAIAKEFNCAMLGLSQIRKTVDDRQDKRPTLSDYGDSSSFDREAAVALAIYRDEYYNKKTAEPGIAEILVLKNRFGSTGTAKLLFDAPFGEFKNLVRERHF